MKNKNAIKLFFIFIYVSAGTFIYWILYKRPLIGIDDANIYFIYMRNFALGHGFVYNVDGEKVEGFTSLLWTLTGSVFFKLSAYPEFFLLIFNIVIVTLTLWQLAVFIDKLFEDNRTLTPYAYFILGATLLLPGYFDWTILTLMETGLWSCLLIYIIITLCRFEFKDENLKRNNFTFSLLLILLVLCRPESFLWGFCFLAVRCWQLIRLKKYFSDTSPLRKILLPLSCFALSAAGIMAWRLSYFGYPFPNTYYAKISSDHLENFIQGVRYDFHFFKDNFFLLVIFCSAIIYFVSAIRKKITEEKKYPAAIMFICILISLLVPLYSGGDHFKLARFIQPVVPLFYLLFVVIIPDYNRAEKIKSKIYTVITCSFFVLIFSPAYNLIDYMFNEGLIQNEFNLARERRNLGERLSDFFYQLQPLPSVGLGIAGAEAFAYKGVSMDLLGLNNVSIAHANPVKTGIKNHASFDKECFYNLAPDIFSITNFVQDTSGFLTVERTVIFNADPFGEWYKGIFSDEKFRENYFPVFIFKKGEKNILHTYANKNFLALLDTVYYSYKIIPG